MLVFRSEEHLERWLHDKGYARGVLLPLSKCWQLGQVWYSKRLDEDWRRFTPKEAAAIFRNLGLAGEFWEY